MVSNLIPTIDMQDFPGQYEVLRKTCEELGSFRLVNHNIRISLMAEMKKVVKSLLDLPMEIKKRNADVLLLSGTGYVAPSKINPLYESLSIYEYDSSASSQAVNTFCSQVDASPHQREVIELYAKSISELAIDLATHLARSMGCCRNELFEGWTTQFKLNRYNFTPETLGSSGVQIHTDTGFVTILQDDENVCGLEIMDESGAFVAVDPEPGAFIVNLGDVAKVWSNGRLKNLKHRVQCKEENVRISIATFLLGPKEEAIEAQPEFVDAQHPRLYNPVTVEEFKRLRTSLNCHAGEALELLRIKSQEVAMQK